MVNTFQQFIQDVGDNRIGDYTFVDADTLRDKDGQLLRIQGYDAPEIAGFKGPKGQETWKPGTAGSAEGTRAIINLIRQGNYSNVIDTGQVDPNGRSIIRLQNEKGQDFTQEIFKHNILDQGKYTIQEDLEATEVAKLFGTNNEGDDAWSQAAQVVSNAIADESYKDLIFKEAAINESLYNPVYNTAALEFDHLDRDLQNNSLNPFSDSWDIGVESARQGFYGTLNLLGERTNSELLADIGEAGVKRIQSRLDDKAKILLDYKDVDGFWTGLEFVKNNTGVALPYILGLAGATVVGGGVGAAAAAAGAGAGVSAGLAAGIGLGSPSTIYIGQIWNEMEGDPDQKSATVAIGAGVLQASLDRLGLSHLIKSGLGTNQLYNKAVKELVKKGATKEAAEQQLANATRQDLASFLKDAGKIADNQKVAKQTTLSTLKNIGKAAGSGVLSAGAKSGSLEALTEGTQEAIGYLAAHYGSDVSRSQSFNFSEFQQRLLAGAIAGGTIGAGFGIPGGISNAVTIADAEWGIGIGDLAKRSKLFQLAEEEKRVNGRSIDIREIAANVKNQAIQNPSEITFNDRAEADKARRNQQSWQEEAIERGSNITSLFETAGRNVISEDLQERSRAARILGSIIGGQLGRVFAGANIEEATHHRATEYKNSLPDQPENIYGVLNNGKPLTEARRIEISKNLENIANTYVDKNGKFDRNLVPKDIEHRDYIINLIEVANNVGNRVRDDQLKTNPELGKINNYLFKRKSIDIQKVNEDPKRFKALLKQEYNLSDEYAQTIVDAFNENPLVNSLDDAFSLAKGKFTPSAHKRRTLGLSENEAFQDFFQQDLFTNIDDALNSAARYVTHQEYIGDNGAIISKLLDQMEAEGIPTKEVNKVAAGLKDILDAQSGNFKRPTSEQGKKLLQVQKNFLYYTALAGLPLATISSFVEAGLTQLALRPEQIFGKKGSLKAFGEELAHSTNNALKDITNFTLRRANEIHTEGTEGKKAVKRLGYLSWNVGAATTTGVTEINKAKAKNLEAFFKVTGLQGWTNFTRAARAAVAGDYIYDKIDVIVDQRKTGRERTNWDLEAEEALQHLGIDYDTLIELQEKRLDGRPVTDEEIALETRIMTEGMFNWVNNAVALPQAANRPLIYQDPRFALFTQFQGFIATFTANHIPKLWGEYVKRGSPAMKYNAFAVMTTMIMLGFASQWIKDQIKYGEDTPYLEGSEYIQRGIRASGLMGSGERIFDLFFPLYGDNRNESTVGWVFNTARDESPALSNIRRLGQAGKEIVEGDFQKGIYHTLKVTPGLGPFTSLNEWISEGVTGGWNYRGE